MIVNPQNLRNTADFMQKASGVDASWLREAADEIESLRAEVMEIFTENGRLANELMKLRSQLVRAKDFLQTLVDNDPSEPIADDGSVVLDLWRHQVKQFLSEVVS